MKFFIFIIIFSNILLSNNSSLINRAIFKTDQQYKSVKDYEVSITVSMKVPAFRMPKKKYKVFFKQPDYIKVKSKGFGILPKTGIFTSPNDNFDNLSDISIKKMIDKVLKDKTRVNELINVVAYVPSKLADEPVAKFSLTLSIKVA